MKINMSLERYDIDSLEEVYNASERLRNKSEELEKLGEIMKFRLAASEDEFETINYVRVKEAIDDYLLKMKLMREELTELSKSCHDFAEKIAEIWS